MTSLRFALALFEGSLLKPASLAAMTTPAHTNGGDASVSGLGLFIRDGGRHGEWWGHGGSTTGYRSGLRYYPDSGVIVAVLANGPTFPRTNPLDIAADLAHE